MKENLLKTLDTIIESLKNNKIQGIEVRGAIAASIQFKSALSVIDENDLVALVQNVAVPVKAAEPTSTVISTTTSEVKGVLKESTIVKQ